MRVAIVLRTFPPDSIGGMETQTKQMGTKLQESDHEVTVFTKGPSSPSDGDVPYEIVRVRNWQITPILSDFTFLVLALLALLRRRDEFDLVQCMMIYPIGFLGYIHNKLTGTPYFAWIRGGDYYLMNDVRWKRWMMRRVLEDTLVLAQSEEIRRDVITDFDDIDCQIGVLGNAVSIPDETASGDGILYVGRLAPKKGLEYLIETMAAVDAPLTIVGDGSEREKLERLARSVEADITFVGEVAPNEVDTYYRDSKVFVLPSIEGEGMPNVVLEAMSWGLPVIATDSGGLPTVIDDGATGFIVPMRNPDALGDRLTELLHNPEQRAEMGIAAREYARKNHSWDWLVSELDRIYIQLTKKNHSDTD